MPKVLGLLLMPISICIWLLPTVEGNGLVMLPLAITVLLAANVLLLLEDASDNVLFLVFQGTFFIFIAAGPLIDAFSGIDFYESFAADVVRKTYTCYWLAAFALWWGCLYRAVRRGRPVFKRRDRAKEQGRAPIYDYEKIRLYAKILFYIAIAAYAAVTADKILFRQTYSLGEYYATYGVASRLPGIVVKIGDSHLIALTLFLAAKPSKEEARLPMLLFMLVSAMTLLYGVRNVVILNALLLIVYFVSRNTQEETWLSRKALWLGAVLSPVAVILLQAFDAIRRSVSFSVLEVREIFSLSLIRDFFVAQSVSSYILSNAITYSDLLGGQPVPYTFGTLYTYLTQNMITRFFTGAAAYSSNSVESATYGANLGSRLAYFLYPESYLNGVGMGGSYVADLFVDFSYAGVFLGTLLACLFAAKLTRVMRDKNSSPYALAFVLVAIRWFIYLPRDSCFAWAMQAFSIMNLLFVLAVWFVTRPKKPGKLRAGPIET